MRKISAIILVCVSIFAAGCASLDSFVSGPLKAKVVVADFEIKDIKNGQEISPSLRSMVVRGLRESHQFLIIEPQKVKGADLIISVAVSEFEPQASGGKSGVGGGGSSGSSFLGGLLGADLNKAHIGLEIRIADASTSEVLATAKIKGEASEAPGGFFKEKTRLAGGLSAYVNTPMERAINLCINESVRFVLHAVPARFYKYYK